MSSNDQRQNVEDQEWYHGYRPRKDAKSLLKQPGDFLVRATDSGGAATTEIVISAIANDRKFKNLTLKFDDPHWSLSAAKKEGKSGKFKSIVELINYYREHGINKKLKLSRVIVRPLWMIKHASVSYKPADLLGKGNFCTVYKGTLKRGTEELTVAVKISHSAANSEAETEAAMETRKAMMHEAQIMSYYAHENIILFHGVACDVKPVLVIMELCPGGDLQTHLTKNGKDMSVQEKILYAFEGASGMAYLHSKNCIHRDLAARNCLISAHGAIKIADFGLSKITEEVDAKSEKEAKDESNAQLPIRWMAPESLKKPYTNFTLKSDVWSFGVMVYEIFNNGTKPWPDDDVREIAKNIRRGQMPKMPESTPSPICDIIAKIWVIDVEKRLKMKDIFCKLMSLYKDDPVADASKLTLNKIKDVKRTALFTSDDTETEDSSGLTDNEDRRNRLPRTGRTRTGGERRRRSASGRSKNKSMDS